MIVKIDENAYLVITDYYRALIVDGIEFGLGSPV